MDCPICGLTNPKSALRCDCGYDFASRSIETSYLDRRSTAPETTSPTADPALLRHWLAEVQQGGRLVVFEYCVSFLVITLRRRSKPQLIRSGEDAAARGRRYSRISLLCGWWGIPWGPIWTIGSLMTNLRGGRDVTEALLGVSPPNAKADLFDDYIKGSQKACQEIERQAQRNKPALERLGRRAEAFRTQIQRFGLQSGGAPDLYKAYGLVLRDYLASDAVIPSHAQKMPEQKLVSPCADHFHDFWIGQRKEWPKAQTGEPDWVVIYMQILDHYFRLCRHQVR